jgi:DNA-binding transcriptional LysR family regulator
VAPVELSSLPMIYLPKKDLLRPVLDKALAGAGVAGNPMALQTSNAALARRSLMQGRSIGCLFTHLVQADVADGTLVALPISAKLPAVEVTIAKSKRLLTQRPVALLLEMIRRGLAAEGG